MENKSKTIGIFEQIRNDPQPEPITVKEFEKAIKKMEKDDPLCKCRIYKRTQRMALINKKP